jgi:antitoxin component YwqK of YwqJK toxin-antitoxin module
MRLNIQKKYRKVYRHSKTLLDQITDGWQLYNKTDRTLEYLNPSDPTQTIIIEYSNDDDEGELAISSVGYFKNDQYHRREGPALMYYSDNKIYKEFWYLNDQLFRADGPALIEYREDGSVSLEEYYINDKLHREDGPARIIYNNGRVSYESYYINNKLHREDGPAWIQYGSDGTIEQEYYFVHDKQVSLAEFERKYGTL